MTAATERWTLPDNTRRCYLDASALAKLYLHERESDALNTAMQQSPELAISDLSITETISAAARKHREGALGQSAVGEIHRLVLTHREEGVFACLALTAAIHRDAERLLLSRSEVPLRAADALHLAQAQAAGASVLVTFDERLARAAEAVGLLAFPRVV